MNIFIILLSLLNIAFTIIVLSSIAYLKDSILSRIDYALPEVETYDENTYDILAKRYEEMLVEPHEYVKKLIEIDDSEGVEIITYEQEKENERRARINS
jgi:hypothetical protein